MHDKFPYTFINISESFAHSVAINPNSAIQSAISSKQALHEVTYLSGRFGMLQLAKALSAIEGFDIRHAYLGTLQTNNTLMMRKLCELNASTCKLEELYEPNSYEYKSIEYYRYHYVNKHDSDSEKTACAKFYRILATYDDKKLVEHIGQSKMVYLNHSNLSQIKRYLGCNYNYVRLLCHLEDGFLRGCFHFILSNSYCYPPWENPLNKHMDISNKIIATYDKSISFDDHIDLCLEKESKCKANQYITK